MRHSLTIYTDGSCRGNPGPGGFGVVVLDTEKEVLLYKYSKQCEDTTNNREELKAILWTFFKYGSSVDIPIVYTDSSYCFNTLTNWMFTWAKNNWIKSNKQQPENLDLIKEFYDYWQRGYRIELRRIEGHSGNKWNDMADKLATNKIKME